MRRLSVLAALVFAVLAGLLTALPADATTTTAASLLAKLDVRVEAASASYVRKAFRYPVDADRDTCDSREETLIDESRVATSVGIGCAVTAGRWFSAYDGRTWTHAREVRVGHLVPFKEAWESGASRWSATARRRFANDLAFGWALNVMSPGLKQSKGARDPAAWLPPRARCAYAKHWVAVKYRWRLAVDRAEKRKLSAVLSGACGSKTLSVPKRAPVASSSPTSQVTPTAEPPPPVTSTLALRSLADTYVSAVQPDANRGTSGSMAVYGSPEVQSLLRFALPAAAQGESLVGARLRLTTTSLASAGSSDVQQVRQAADTWTEGSVTWRSRPGLVGAVLGSTSAARAASTAFDVALDPALVSAHLGKPLSIALVGTGTDSLWVASREWPTAGHRPSLTLEFAALPSSGATTPPAAPDGNTSAPSPPAGATAAPGEPVTVMTVGDIACQPGSPVTERTCRHADVASVVTASEADFFIPLGDLQYNVGSLGDFMGPGGYDSAFRGLKARTLPVIGNHEHLDPAGIGQGYFDYFYGSGVATGAFGDRAGAYYARTIGSWQFIGINSECVPDHANDDKPLVGGCAVGSPQYKWLESVLASSTARCTLVAFHRPRWSTGSHPPFTPMADMWDLMARSGVDVTVSGHNHSSEVFQRIGASGAGTTPVLDPNGIRSFVAGGGGSSLYSTTSGSTAAAAALQARDFTTFGPLRLTLRDGSFDWQYHPIAGQTFTNAPGTSGAFSGTAEPCH